MGSRRRIDRRPQPQPRPLLSQIHDQEPRLLFPGMVPGRPISPHAMTQKLSRHDITVRAAHNGALAALAADLPAAILADLLGMHANTAVRWVIYARRDWTDYLADRAEEQIKKQEIAHAPKHSPTGLERDEHPRLNISTCRGSSIHLGIGVHLTPPAKMVR
jgi:hypothetical protein